VREERKSKERGISGNFFFVFFGFGEERENEHKHVGQ